MDVNSVKPVPVVQKPRKVERERQRRERGQRHTEPEVIENDDSDDGSKRIDTYA